MLFCCFYVVFGGLLVCLCQAPGFAILQPATDYVMRFLYLFATTVRVTASCLSFFLFLFCLSSFFNLHFLSLSHLSVFFAFSYLSFLPSFRIIFCACCLHSFFSPSLQFSYRLPFHLDKLERCRVEAMRVHFNSGYSFA